MANDCFGKICNDGRFISTRKKVTGEGGVWVLFATGQSEGELSWNKAQQSNIRTENSNKDINLLVLPSISSRVLLLITVDDELGNKNEK